MKDKRRAPAYAAGTERRTFDVARAAKENPGANVYKPNATFTQTGSSKWVFGTETRKPPGVQSSKGATSPGPGNYEIEPVAFDAKRPRFHVGQKFKD